MTDYEKAIEDISDKLITPQFDLDHKYHSAMEHFNLLRYKDNLKSEKAKLEAKLKATRKR